MSELRILSLSLNQKGMKFHLIVGFLIFVFFTGVSQEMDIPDNPKVGLVLSGGGAKGFAHIGVLKVLEEAGVQIDYIGGTSMGAVVGGLYSSGYSANDIDSIIRSIDFVDFLQDKLPRRQFSFFHKQYDEKYLASFPVRDKKIGLPKSLATGQSVYNDLSKLLESVNHISDFKELPIPFYCVATNIETGEGYVFDEGYLPAAIRASASLPTLLDPMYINGVSYIDGGIADNFPVDEMLKKGVDIVIGVDVQGRLQKQEDISSAVGVLNQIIDFQMYARVDENTEKVDVYFKPDLTGYGMTSFEGATEIIEKGEGVANEQIVLLQEIAKKQEGERGSRLKISEKNKKMRIKRVNVSGIKHYSIANILGKLKLEENDSITYEDLNNKIGGLTSSNEFDLVQYKFHEPTKGGTELDLHLRESDISTYVKLGLHYDPLYKSSVLLNLTMRHLMIKNDVLSTDLILGDNVRFNLNYFIDNGQYVSFGFNSRFNKLETNVAYDGVDVNSINKSYDDFTSMLYVQTTFNKYIATGIGVEHKKLKVYTNSLNSELAENITTYFDDSNYLSTVGYVKLDTYDRVYAPKSGLYIDGEFKWYMGSSDYNEDFHQFYQTKLKLGGVQTFFNRVSTHLTLEGGATIGDKNTEQFKYSLGGYGENMINNHVPFYGYAYEDLQNFSFAKGEIEVRYEFIDDNFLSFTSNFARTDLDLFNDGNLFEDVNSGYAAGYGVLTLLGPVDLKYSWSPDTSLNVWYFSLGFWF